MKVRVKVQFNQGKKLGRFPYANAPAILGSLSMCRLTSKGTSRAAMTLRPLDDNVNPDLLPKLWEPELDGLGHDKFAIRGLEQLPNGQLVVQIWVCEIDYPRAYVKPAGML